MQENIDIITQNRRAIREELEVNTAKAIKSKENKCTRLMRIMLTWSHLSKYWVNSSALNKIFGGHYTELELRCICFRCVCVCVCVCVCFGVGNIVKIKGSGVVLNIGYR